MFIIIGSIHTVVPIIYHAGTLPRLTELRSSTVPNG